MYKLEVELYSKNLPQGMTDPSFELEFETFEDCKFYIRNRMFQGLGDGKTDPPMIVKQTPKEKLKMTAIGTHAGLTFILRVREV